MHAEIPGRRPMPIEAAEGGVMASAPGQEALGFAHYPLHNRTHPAPELERIAADKIARRIGFVELLAPKAGRRCAIAVGWLGHIAVDLGVGMKHQVLPDEATGISKPVRKPTGGRIQQ